MSEMKHDRFFGPSMWPKLYKCPSYRSDESQNSPAASKGTELHMYLQDILEDKPSRANLSLISKSEVNGIHWVATVVEESLKSFVCEKIITVYSPEHEERTTGTADIIGRNQEGKLVVMDLKTGNVRDYMLQIMAYAIGVMQREGESECKGVLIYSREKKMDCYDFVLKDCLEEMEQLYAERCKPNPRRFVGEYCRWCAESQTCVKKNQPSPAETDGQS